MLRMPISQRAQQLMGPQNLPPGTGGNVRNAPAYPGTFGNSDQFLPSGEWSAGPKGHAFTPDQAPDPRSILSRGQLIQANDSAGNPFRSTWAQPAADRFKAGNWDAGPSEEEHQAALASLRAQKYGPGASGYGGQIAPGGQPFGAPPGYPAASLSPDNTGGQYTPPGGPPAGGGLASTQAGPMTQAPQMMQRASIGRPQGMPMGGPMGQPQFGGGLPPQIMQALMARAQMGGGMGGAPMGGGGLSPMLAQQLQMMNARQRASVPGAGFQGGFGGAQWHNPGREGTAGDAWGKFQHDSWNAGAQRGGPDQWDQMPSSYVRASRTMPGQFEVEDRPVFGGQNDPAMMEQARQFVDSYNSQVGGGAAAGVGGAAPPAAAPAAAQQVAPTPQPGGDGRLSSLRGRMQNARQTGDMDRFQRLFQRRQNVMANRGMA